MREKEHVRARVYVLVAVIDSVYGRVDVARPQDLNAPAYSQGCFRGHDDCPKDFAQTCILGGGRWWAEQKKGEGGREDDQEFTRGAGREEKRRDADRRMKVDDGEERAKIDEDAPASS